MKYIKLAIERNREELSDCALADLADDEFTCLQDAAEQMAKRLEINRWASKLDEPTERGELFTSQDAKALSAYRALVPVQVAEIESEKK